MHCIKFNVYTSYREKACAPSIFVLHASSPTLVHASNIRERRAYTQHAMHKQANTQSRTERTRGRRENLAFGGSVEVLLMQRGPLSPKGGASTQLKRTKNKSTPNVSAMCTGHSSQRPSLHIAHRRCTLDVHVWGGWSRCMAVVQRLERLDEPMRALTQEFSERCEWKCRTGHELGALGTRVPL